MNRFLYFSLVFLLFGCNPSQNEENPESVRGSDNSISLSAEQIQLAGILTGKLEMKTFSEKLICSGNIETTPNGLAALTSPMGGFIKSIDHYIGQKVHKNEVVAILENSDFIILQENYLRVKSKLEFLDNEYKRKKELYQENAVSERDYLSAKSEYEVRQAEFLSIKARLKMLGLDPEKINKSQLSPEILIRSPIDGYISNIYGNKGKFVNETDIIIEIVNSDKLHLHLKVFEKDISKIYKNQSINFYSLSEPEKKYTAKVLSLGHSVNKEDLSVTVHALIMNRDNNLIPGLFVNAELELNKQQLYAIPEEGILRNNEMNYIFLKNENSFYKTPVQTGLRNNNFISIIDPGENIINAEIVIQGAYFINAAFEGSEEE